MEIYLLKSSVSLCILYTFYWFILRNETHFNLNRIYLIATLLISFISPLFNLPLFGPTSNKLVNIISPIIVGSKAQTGAIISNNGLSILSIVYISGAVFFALKFLSNLSKIWYLYNRFPKVKYNDFRAVIVDGNISPFTFFSVLFLSRSDFEEGNTAELIMHEKSHKEHLHSIDVVIMEIAAIVQWFNPFIWLIRMALKAEHEFIADSNVLEKGYDKATYQNLLFEKSLGVMGLGITSHFNYSLLKTRLKMMTIKKSGRSAIAKYLIALPLMLSVSLILSSSTKVFAQEKVYDKADVMPVYSGGDDGVRNFIMQNLKYPENAAEQGIQARIFVLFTVTDKGDVKDVKIAKTVLKERDKEGKFVDKDYTPTGVEKYDQAVKALEAESIRVVKTLGKFTPGKIGGKNVNVQYTFPITFVLQ